MKRIKKMLMIAVLMGTMLTGCGKQAQPTETKQETTDIQVNTDEIEMETREFGGISVQMPAESTTTNNKYYDYMISSNPKDQTWVRVCDDGIVSDITGINETNIDDFVDGMRKGFMTSSDAIIKVNSQSGEVFDNYILVRFELDVNIDNVVNHTVGYHIINRSNNYSIAIRYFSVDDSLPYYDFFEDKMVNAFTVASNDTNEQETGDIDPTLKEFLDSYEAFIDEYIEFMARYQQNPTDTTLLSEYTNIMNKYSEFAQEISEWQGKQAEMSAADWNYYIDVTTRCNQKMSNVALGYSQ
jgi:hypothetical protein